jgi:hypothetical protein
MGLLRGAIRAGSLLGVLMMGCGDEALPELPVRPAPAVEVAPSAVAVTPSLGERLAVERALADATDAYRPIADEAGYVLPHPAGMVATITESAADLSFSGHQIRLGAVSIGRGEVSVALSPGSPSLAGQAIETERGTGITEWWRSLPSGLEHGVTIEARPSGEGELAVRVAVEGAEIAAASDTAVSLLGENGERIAEYRDLWVTDATGAVLPARLAVRDALIEILVDDTDATYPIVVDPYTIATEATLAIPSTSTFSDSKHTPSLSADGTRMVVGVHRGATVPNSARVYAWNGTSWGLEQALTGSLIAAGDRFGENVAISGDGLTIVVGAPYRDAAGADSGSAYVFVRSGTTWSEQARLAPSIAAAGDLFGQGVAITADGSRIMIGAPQSDVGGTANAGQVFEFTRSGSTWSEVARLVPPTFPVARVDDCFGWRLACDDTCSRVIVGAPTCPSYGGTNSGRGAIFVRSGGVLTSEHTIDPGSVGGSRRPWASDVAMSGDGSVAAYGARNFHCGSCNGADARVLTRSGTAWTTRVLPTPTGSCGTFGVGAASAINRDGSVIVAGSLSTANVFVRTAPGASTWTADACSVVGGGAGDLPVAISRDATRAAIGTGTNAYVFALRAPQGAACTIDSQCASGFCTDGVCCESACGGGAADCQSCLNAATGAVTGLCRGLIPAMAGGVCRPSSGMCDVAETCVAGMAACPIDGFASNTTTCRGVAGPCDVAETCTGSSATCPTDGFMGMTTCRASTGICDPAERCTGSSAACPAEVYAPSSTECRAAAGPCDPADFCTGSSGACPTNAVSPVGTVCRALVPGGCDAEDVCNGVSGTCPDVVAPADSVCRPSMGGCDLAEACDGVSGACPSDTVLPPGTVCRAAAGLCDVAESCSGGATCPANLFRTASDVCRAASGLCDAPENCSGVSAVCPPDVFATADTTCRPSVGACDVAELCTGVTTACPGDGRRPSGFVCDPSMVGPCDAPDTCNGVDTVCPSAFASGIECRPAAGACDIAEACNGATAACPMDVLQSNGTACGAGGSSCSSGGTCNGTNPSCPGATPLPRDTVCLAAMPGNPCDLDDICDGVSDACNPRFADAVVSCGPATAGACDAPDHCAGTSADCVPTFLAGVECRASSGACDLPETCAGGDVMCPPDTLVSAGVTCRGSSMACDPEEVCDGASSVCAPDISSCADAGEIPDGGAPGADAGGDGDAGPGVDGSIGADVGPPPPTTGCACRAGRRESGALGISVLGLLVALGLRRRRSSEQESGERS